MNRLAVKAEEKDNDISGGRNITGRRRQRMEKTGGRRHQKKTGEGRHQNKEKTREKKIRRRRRPEEEDSLELRLGTFFNLPS